MCDMPLELEVLVAEIRTRYRWLLCELQIELIEDGVVLRGKAITYYGKQVAQHELLRRGFVVAANHIVVSEPKRP